MSTSRIQDVIDALEDANDAIEDALRTAKKIEDDGGPKNTSKSAAIDAINKIRGGDYASAITTLEREFLPKWKDVADAEVDYRRAMVSRPEPREWRR